MSVDKYMADRSNGNAAGPSLTAQDVRHGGDNGADGIGAHLSTSPLFSILATPYLKPVRRNPGISTLSRRIFPLNCTYITIATVPYTFKNSHLSKHAQPSFSSSP